MTTKAFYVTTPIYYVNAQPHIGSAYTTIAADVTTRFVRLQGRPAYFLTGTDENGTKIVEAAQEQGKTPIQFVNEIVGQFKEAWSQLHIEYDDFIRTTEERHIRCVQEFWRRLKQNGDIYKGIYEGWYCVRCETYWLESEVPDGLCPNPECRRPVRRAEEETYFFRLSAYQDRLLRHIEEHPNFLQPEFRRNEVVSFIKQGLRDACISRSATDWGIPVPDDPSQTIYVWFDALINYVSATGWPDEGELFHRLWPADIHFMAKDIFVRFHSTLWPCMLMSAGLELPKRIVGHGFWTADGQKMSKSTGNAYAPMEVAQALSSASGCQIDVALDALRYYLLREVPFGLDGDFSSAGLVTRFNSDLANDLGNLLNRALALAQRYFGGAVPEPGAECPLATVAEETSRVAAAALEDLAYSSALQAIWSMLAAANRYFNDQAPWRLHKEGRVEEAGAAIYAALETTRIAAVQLWPFMPHVSLEMARQLGLQEPPNSRPWSESVRWGGLRSGTKLAPGNPIFPRIEGKKALLGLGRKEAGEKDENEVQMSTVTIDEFQKLEFRTARVQAAEPVPGAKKLLKLTISLGGEETRTVVAGIAEQYSPEELVGKTVVLVANLAPATIRGVVSQGMVLAADLDGAPILVTTEREVPPGAKVR